MTTIPANVLPTVQLYDMLCINQTQQDLIEFRKLVVNQGNAQILDQLDQLIHKVDSRVKDCRQAGSTGLKGTLNAIIGLATCVGIVWLIVAISVTAKCG